MEARSIQSNNPTPKRINPNSLSLLAKNRLKSSGKERSFLSSSSGDGKKPKDSTLLAKQHYSALGKGNALFPIAISFIASTIFSIGTHLKEEPFGPATKFLKLPSTSLAILLGTATAAGWLTYPTNASRSIKPNANTENSIRIEVS